jgi:hypothetical protein
VTPPGAGAAHHVPPPPGEPQPGEGPRTNQADFVNVAGRLFAPLQGVNPADVLQGGYAFLDVTDGGATLHPGADLNSGGSCNADEGLLVVAPLAGTVRAVLPWDGSSSGEGNHVWVELDDPCLPGPTWLHVDHLFDIACAVGQQLLPGEPIGLAGRSGGWECAHLHTELLTGPPHDGWFQWPYGWSRAQVEAAYWPPLAWWQAATALVLAEGHEPIPPEVVEAMNDWELTNYVLAQLYEWAQLPFDPESGMAKTWVAALRAGVYARRPRTDARPYGEGDGTGWWAEFDQRVLIYNRDGTMSWNG